MKAMPGRRHQRVSKLLQRELSQILLRELPVSKAGVVNINEVSMSGDLHSAVVFVGLLGSDEQRRLAANTLREQRKRIQGLLGHSVSLKYIPEIRFEVDDSNVRGQRVLGIIEEIEKTLPPDID